MEDVPLFDSNVLLEILKVDMPFGKYKGRKLADLPDAYLAWFSSKGSWPEGKLGQLMATVHEIKMNGLEYLLKPLK